MIVVVDYGVGNLFSLVSSLKAIGQDAVVSGDLDVVATADKIILPGVGAFGDAAAALKESGLFDVVVARAKAGVPLLGICLGMQLLYERSMEFGEHQGLGLIKGDVLPLSDAVSSDLKIPHIGWNSLYNIKKDGIFKDVEEGEYVYFVHSFYAPVSPATSATAEYGVEITASCQEGNVYGCQFHPEKSHDVGLRILSAFCEL